METGIGNKNKDNFIGIFKAFASDESKEIPVPDDVREVDTPMAWTQFSGMTEEDLGAIYDYLQTLPPIKNRVEKASVTELGYPIIYFCINILLACIDRPKCIY